MAWPPVIPPAGRTNATPQLDAHPSDHNAIAQALTDLVTRLGAIAHPALVVRQGANANTAAAVAGTPKRSDWLKLNGWITASINWAATAAGTATPLWVVFPAGYEPLLTSITAQGNTDATLGAVQIYNGSTNVVGVAYAVLSNVSNTQGFTVIVHNVGGYYSTALAAGHSLVAALSYAAATP